MDEPRERVVIQPRIGVSQQGRSGTELQQDSGKRRTALTRSQGLLHPALERLTDGGMQGMIGRPVGQALPVNANQSLPQCLGRVRRRQTGQTPLAFQVQLEPRAIALAVQ